MRKLLVLVALAGCSVTLQKKPTRAVSDDCSSSPVYAVIDSALAAGAAAAMVYGLARENPYAAGTGAPASVLFLGAAANGFEWSRTCGARSAAATATR